MASINKYGYDLSESECFIGRKSIIDKLKNILFNEKKSCCLLGQGGIGKTEIIKRIINEITTTNYTEITDIIWVTCSGDGIKAPFAQATAGFCDIYNSAINVDAVYSVAINKLRTMQEQVLIVIDNVELDDLSLVKNLQQECPKLRILISSRVSSIDIIHTETIEPLSEEECVSLFGYHYQSEVRQDEKSILKKINKLAGWNTILVEFLAKVAKSEKLKICDLHDRLVKQGFDISPEKVSSTHQLMKEEDVIVEQLKKLFSTLNCKEYEINILIPASVVPNLHYDLERAKKWFGFKANSDLYGLVNKGWLQKEKSLISLKETFFMHSLIAQAVRLQYIEMLHQKCRNFMVELTEEMEKCYVKPDSEKIELIQFGWSLSDLLKSYENEYEIEDAKFLFSAVKIYQSIDYYERANEIWSILFKIDLSKNSDLFLQTHSVYAEYLRTLHQYKDAINECEILVGILNKTFHKEIPSDIIQESYIPLYRNIARYYSLWASEASNQNQIYYEKSSEYYDRALELCKKIQCDIKIELSVHINRLELLKTLQYYKEAVQIGRSLIQETKAIVEEDTDVYSMYIALLRNYTNICLEWYQIEPEDYLDNGAPTYELLCNYQNEVIAYFTKVTSEGNEETLRAKNCRASLDLIFENYQEAVKQYEDIVHIYEKREKDSNYLDEFSDRRLVYYNLAYAYYQLAVRDNKKTYFYKAEEYVNQALKDAEKIGNASDIALYHELLGDIHSKESEFERAASEYNIAYEIYLKQGEDDFANEILEKIQKSEKKISQT